ncbi:MAG TPA: hypothetical protein VGW75_16020, partial [Solirubrobacteraceae bacterium]|nr:hypothetical protein [Solirubrobacteraceae bacterium]
MRLAIVGAAGGVGSATAFAAILAGTVDELVLLDEREGPLQAQQLDLEQLRGTVRPVSVATGDWSAAAAADVAVISASAPHRDGLARLDYLRANAEIAADVARRLEAAGTLPRTIAVATNPVDHVCTLLHRRLGLPRERLLGFSANDSARLAFAVAEAIGVEPSRVTAWSLGEHGELAVPLLGRVQLDGEPLELAPEVREAAIAYTRGWYARWQACSPGRTSTWMTGQGLAALVERLGGGGADAYPASVVLDGEYGVRGVSLTVPVRLEGGAARVLEWPLTPAEADGLRA